MVEQSGCVSTGRARGIDVKGHPVLWHEVFPRWIGKDDAIEIEIEGDEITPNGELIKVRVGETVRLELESDRRGELHVHATPEQELDFGRGRTSLEVTIDTPGVVDVEEHESGVVILQLQVR